MVVPQHGEEKVKEDDEAMRDGQAAHEDVIEAANEHVGEVADLLVRTPTPDDEVTIASSRENNHDDDDNHDDDNHDDDNHDGVTEAASERAREVTTLLRQMATRDDGAHEEAQLESSFEERGRGDADEVAVATSQENDDGNDNDDNTNYNDNDDDGYERSIDHLQDKHQMQEGNHMKGFEPPNIDDRDTVEPVFLDGEVKHEVLADHTKDEVRDTMENSTIDEITADESGVYNIVVSEGANLKCVNAAPRFQPFKIRGGVGERSDSPSYWHHSTYGSAG
ncbi:Hypothetical Protein FCC1311_114812 [Hondaea fermentalgiana]|uniref:Uncharacterized protein n=1 Tax=Hondaea fermentalgiana TaxID=2315210 RepID=A0A2R5GZM1_9STRA|nr:Hypothetical Protein FCC1311_114812 [Hondaea fermentalgiana]|eukprot:GBG35258.1 Hypothetical Protein FCC1311_114812 [Hondaea fermentalgiana]